MPERLPMLTRFEQARVFMVRAEELENEAALVRNHKLKETLLNLAQQYRQLAEKAANRRYG
jgi:DNA-directed RNA polymerase subunit K/omega